MIDYKQLPKISCIYKIVNLLEPSKVYVGSTKNLRARVRQHTYKLKYNNHINCILQNAVNKYGLNNFNVHIIDYCNPENLLTREQFWLDTLNPFYNICKKADGGSNSSHKIETKLKVSNTIKSKNLNIDTLGILNVCYKTHDKGYVVNIRVNNKQYYLGSFKLVEQAKEIADKYRTASEQDIIDYIKSNKKLNKIKKSKYKYVSYKLNKNNKQLWYSYYRINRNEKLFFGYFDTELEAVRAYNNYITINKINKPILIIKDNN